MKIFGGTQAARLLHSSTERLTMVRVGKPGVRGCGLNCGVWIRWITIWYTFADGRLKSCWWW